MCLPPQIRRGSVPKILPTMPVVTATKTDLAKQNSSRERSNRSHGAPLAHVEQFTGGCSHRNTACYHAHNLSDCLRIRRAQWTSVGFLHVNHIGPAGKCCNGFRPATHTHQKPRQLSK